MEKAAFTLRPMEPGDIVGAIKLSNAEGWNQEEKDWKFLIGNPQNVCMLAECDKKIIGTTTAINYSNKIAWIGMVLVDKKYRGMGVSKALLINVLKKLESCKSVKLDATSEGQKVYKNFGFKDEYVVTRMTNSSVDNLLIEEDGNSLAEPVETKYIPGIIAYDEYVFGANRTALIGYLLKEYPDKSWLLKSNTSIAGVALGRAGNKYHHVGPVFASNTNDAKKLITTALKKLIKQPVVVDVLNDKEDLISWLDEIGFVKQRHFVRMYQNKNQFPGIIENQFLISGPEFG